HLEHGPAVGPNTARRLACNPLVTALLHDEEGRVIDVGRKKRLVTPALRRLVNERDAGMCTFPGCTNRRWLDGHHIVHWEDGGATNQDNLLLLCSRHHRVHHSGAINITGPAERPEFTTEDGRLIADAPDMRAVAAPPDDPSQLPADAELGPIEGTWGGESID